MYTPAEEAVDLFRGVVDSALLQGQVRGVRRELLETLPLREQDLIHGLPHRTNQRIPSLVHNQPQILANPHENRANLHAPHQPHRLLIDLSRLPADLRRPEPDKLREPHQLPGNPHLRTRQPDLPSTLR